MKTQTNQQPDQRDGIPETISDDPNPGAMTSDLGESTAAAENEQADEPAAPKPFEDPRVAIARRQAERRAAETKDFEGLEIFPPFMMAAAQGQGDDEDDGGGGGAGSTASQQNDDQQGAAQKAAPSDSQGQTKHLALKINGVDMTVSREDALRYAEIEPSEADLFTDVQVVRLAQKHIAASQLLEEAKHHRNSAHAASVVARAGSPSPGQNSADGPSPGQGETDNEQENANNGGRSGQNQPLTRETVVEALQFEDPEVAGERLDQYVDQRISSIINGQQQIGRLESARDDVQTTLASIEQQHADIAQDNSARQFAVQAMLEEVAADMRRIPGVSEEVVTHLMRTGNLQEAYVRARSDGYNVRAPADIAQAALTRTRQVYRMPPPAPAAGGQQQQQQNGVASRMDAKRGLITQPHGSGAGNSNQRPTNVSVEDHRKKAIQQRRAQARW